MIADGRSAVAPLTLLTRRRMRASNVHPALAIAIGPVLFAAGVAPLWGLWT